MYFNKIPISFVYMLNFWNHCCSLKSLQGSSLGFLPLKTVIHEKSVDSFVILTQHKVDSDVDPTFLELYNLDEESWLFTDNLYKDRKC